jgi:hypothetical protein
MVQAQKVNSAIRTLRNRAWGDNGVYMAGNLHDGRAYNGIMREKPASLR